MRERRGRSLGQVGKGIGGEGGGPGGGRVGGGRIVPFTNHFGDSAFLHDRSIRTIGPRTVGGDGVWAEPFWRWAVEAVGLPIGAGICCPKTLSTGGHKARQRVLCVDR